jgi:hypothetical protein
VLTQIPFFSRFNSGEGDHFVIDGVDTGAGSWNQLAAQDPLPTEVCGEGNTLRASVDYDDAWDGGSALHVSGTSSVGSQRLYLYEAGAPLPPRAAFTLRYRLPAGGSSPAPHVVAWIDGNGPIDLEPASTRSEGGWMLTQATLPASVEPGVLTRIGVGFDADSGQQVDALIGEIGVVDLANYASPVQLSPKLEQVEGSPALTWEDPSPAETRYYNVWSLVPGKSCVAFVGRSTLPAYDLARPLFDLPVGADEFIVQPVSRSGLTAPLAPAPCAPS